jgi:hypothetical protein
MCVISNFGAIFIGLSLFTSVTFAITYYVDVVKFNNDSGKDKEND